MKNLIIYYKELLKSDWLLYFGNDFSSAGKKMQCFSELFNYGSQVKTEGVILLIPTGIPGFSLLGSLLFWVGSHLGLWDLLVGIPGGILSIPCGIQNFSQQGSTYFGWDPSWDHTWDNGTSWMGS